jgi:hypothetical protein
MVRIVVDESLKNEFLRATETCEIYDSSGNKLGNFTREIVGSECPYSEEELEQAEREGGGRPLKEILADLERQI